MGKIFYALSWLTIVSAMGIMCLLGFWLFYPYKPIVFTQLPHTVENKNVKAGDDLTYRVDYCKNLSVSPEISESFVDGIVYVIPTTFSTSNELGCRANTIQITVPKNLPPGVYSIKTTYTYKINPVRNIEYITETEKFNVTK